MPRPKCRRKVSFEPGCRLFRPVGVPMCDVREVVLSSDELEALRLADSEGDYQEAAAKKMAISRSTFSRTVEAARRKVADALVNGKCIRIEDHTDGNAVTGTSEQGKNNVVHSCFGGAKYFVNVEKHRT